MIRTITIAFSLLGLALAIYVVATARHQPPRLPLATPPSINPFAHGIAATGIVEPCSRQVPVAAPEGALVTRVFVDVGDTVAVGDPLFELDPRPLTAELARALAARDAAQAELDRLQAMPRPEELPPLQAHVQALEAEVADLADQWERLVQARGADAASDAEVRRRRFALDAARARLEEARARLALMAAGAWQPDLEIARARLAQAHAAVSSIQALLDRRTVRAPIAGTVLKRNVEPGQFAPADPRAFAIILGDLSRLHLRARVDEEDLQLLRPGSSALARTRGQQPRDLSLTMLRIEPLAQPKTDLTGTTTERIETRVLDVLFLIDNPRDAVLYPGQMLDVFIQAASPPPAHAPSTP